MIVYKTTNTINNKLYIGQQSNELKKPFYLGSGKILKQAIKKYGREKFEKIVLEKCANKEELNEREIYWIKKLNTTDSSIGYNITPGGTGGNTINLLPKYKQKQWLKKVRIANNKTSKRRLSGNFTKAELEGHKKISEIKKGSKNYSWEGYIYVYNENKELIYKFNTIKKAAKDLNIHQRTINKLINKNILYKRFFNKEDLTKISNCYFVRTKNQLEFKN